ncbi:MAG TPA: hypothetical protein DEV93_00455 [Chloroflexi bacterium]|nr:hypothetical protein [Chloroflexota bacterium]
MVSVDGGEGADHVGPQIVLLPTLFPYRPAAAPFAFDDFMDGDGVLNDGPLGFALSQDTGLTGQPKAVGATRVIGAHLIHAVGGVGKRASTLQRGLILGNARL